MACLTLDIEEDYGGRLCERSFEGLEYISELADFFKTKQVPLTCFIQGSILETHVDEIKKLSTLDIEFELHSYSHNNSKQGDVKFEIERGKKAYVNFFNKEPLCYRAPLGVINHTDYEILASNGFRFDSSIFPSLRPGTFNNLRKPTTPYVLNETHIVEFPVTVFSRVMRIPLALSYIKLFGKPYLILLKNVHCPNLIVFDFHLHDLFKLRSSSKIPFENISFFYRMVLNRIYKEKKINGLNTLNEFITLLQRKGFRFLKLVDVYEIIYK